MSILKNSEQQQEKPEMGSVSPHCEEMRGASVDIPAACVAADRQPLSANCRRCLQAVEQQWRRRATAKSACVQPVRCACVCFLLFAFSCKTLFVCALCVCVCGSACVWRVFGEPMGTGGSCSRLQELLTAVRSPDSQPLIKH